MFIRIRVPGKAPQELPLEQEAAYPIRATSVIASVAIHCLVIVCLAVIPPYQPVSNTPILDELIQPDRHKIIYYNFRKRPPDVDPLTKIGDSQRPRANEPSPQAVIATAPNPKSTQQMIWLPAPKIEIRQDVPTPNMIARMNTSLPSLPAPPKEKPAPPAEGVKATQPNTSPPDLKGDTAHAPESANNATSVPKQARTFVPPPPSVTQPKLALPTLISDAPAPVVGSQNMANRLPAGLGMPVLQTAAPPPPSAPIAPLSNPANGTVDVAVASLHPADVMKNTLPEGERPGRFAKAPEAGAPSSGDVGKTAAVIVPNLTVREDKSKPVKPVPDPNSHPVLYTDKVRTIPFSTLSVPLRPSNRSIPRTVEARFQGRNVYTMVVPIENLPAYSGDWILWFAERQPVPGQNPVMRAPLPYRKMEAVDQKVQGNASAERVQIWAMLEKDGRLDQMAISTKAGSDAEQAIVQDLESWEFKPATRDGVPIDVEVVLEITFNLPPTVGRRVIP